MVRVYIETYGCTLNRFDSEVMVYYLQKEGYTIVNNLHEADIIIINSCGVKKQTEDRIISRLKKLRRLFDNRKKIILVGCLPLINYNRVKKETNVDAMAGPSPGMHILKVVKEVEEGNYVEFLNIKEDLSTPSLYINKGEVTKPIGIASGCLDRCSFCGTRNARGYVKSRSIDDIIRLIKRYADNGIKEIYLTSLDNGAYGFDLKPRVSIIDLLRKIDSLSGDFIVRIGMMNPRWAYKYLEDLIEIFRNSKKFYYFLHVPVQSGSNKVLKIMNRGHGVEEYLEVVKRLRKEIDKKFTIMTDIIVGHPGEDDHDFEETLELIKLSMPDYVNISQFFPRPNTPAAYMKKVPTHIVKSRSTELSFLVDKIMFKRNSFWLNWEGAILINEEGRKGRLIGRNYAYKHFAVDRDSIQVGDLIEVKVVQAYTTWLYGEPRKKVSSLYELWKQV